MMRFILRIYRRPLSLHDPHITSDESLNRQRLSKVFVTDSLPTMSLSNPRAVTEEESRHKPRILCLHGGGVTAQIFRMQARSIIRDLPDFRLVFADGPFFCDAGPGINSVYSDYGPFRRWLRWLPEHAEIDDETAIEEIMYAIDTCKENDSGDGPWVGLLGFSQGAKMVSSLLYDQQVRLEKTGKADTDYKFAVLMAGRSPLVSLSEYAQGPAMITAGAMSEGFQYEGVSPHVVKLPTIHLHGLTDEGLHLHRKMLHQYHDPKSSTLLEWGGAHRVPFKKEDVEPLTQAIYEVARQQGVLFEDTR
jgi:predicted esterase